MLVYQTKYRSQSAQFKAPIYWLTFVSFVSVYFDLYSDILIFFVGFTAANIRRRIRLADFFSADIRRTKIRRLIQIFGGGLGVYLPVKLITDWFSDWLIDLLVTRRIQVKQFHCRSHKRIVRRTTTYDGQLRRVRSVSGRRAWRCYSPPALHGHRPTAGQIRHRAVSHHRSHELLRNRRLCIR